MTETAWTFHGGETEYFTCPLLDGFHVPHLFSARKGGVSKGCYASWNFASGTAEEPDDDRNVQQNYEIAARLLGLHREDVCRTYQAHTDKVLTVGENERGVGTVKPKFPFGVDGLVTRTPGLLLSVRTADCVPILLADPEKRICGAVHAGWRGTASAIVRNAVAEMVRLGASEKNILAAIGPCAGKDCYEVGEDVRQAFLSSFEDANRFFRPEEGKEGKYFLDLASANRTSLLLSGLSEDHISVSGICTHCHTDLFFSHRAMGVRRGTMSAFITVDPGGEGAEK